MQKSYTKVLDKFVWLLYYSIVRFWILIMIKVSKKNFRKFLNSLPDSGEVTYCGKYKDGSETTTYFFCELPVGNITATVGRRTKYYINLDYISEVEIE